MNFITPIWSHIENEMEAIQNAPISILLTALLLSLLYRYLHNRSRQQEFNDLNATLKLKDERIRSLTERAESSDIDAIRDELGIVDLSKVPLGKVID